MKIKFLFLFFSVQKVKMSLTLMFFLQENRGLIKWIVKTVVSSFQTVFFHEYIAQNGKNI